MKYESDCYVHETYVYAWMSIPRIHMLQNPWAFPDLHEVSSRALLLGTPRRIVRQFFWSSESWISYKGSSTFQPGERSQVGVDRLTSRGEPAFQSKKKKKKKKVVVIQTRKENKCFKPPTSACVIYVAWFLTRFAWWRNMPFLPTAQEQLLNAVKVVVLLLWKACLMSQERSFQEMDVFAFWCLLMICSDQALKTSKSKEPSPWTSSPSHLRCQLGRFWAKRAQRNPMKKCMKFNHPDQSWSTKSDSFGSSEVDSPNRSTGTLEIIWISKLTDWRSMLVATPFIRTQALLKRKLSFWWLFFGLEGILLAKTKIICGWKKKEKKRLSCWSPLQLGVTSVWSFTPPSFTALSILKKISTLERLVWKNKRGKCAWNMLGFVGIPKISKP